jgi:hypothetical protein
MATLERWVTTANANITAPVSGNEYVCGHDTRASITACY